MTELSLQKVPSIYDDNAPLAEASTIPAPWYVDTRIFELEKQTVFSRTWQMMGRVDQVGKLGQFVTANVAGEPSSPCVATMAYYGRSLMCAGIMRRL